MFYEIFVFDFDGTLVDSNDIKRNAYYKLFPENNRVRSVVDSVLEKYLDRTRRFCIGCIVDGLAQQRVALSNNREELIHSLTEKYTRLTFEGVLNAKEAIGAENLLKFLHNKKLLYLSSNTPEYALKKIIEAKGWDRYFAALYGQPAKKDQTLRRIMNKHGISGKRLLVVGDGISDGQSAELNNCDFWEVPAPPDLVPLIDRLRRNDATR